MMNSSTTWLRTLALFAVLTLPLSLALPLPGWAETEDESQTIDLEKLAEDRKAIAQKHFLGSRVQRYLAAAGEAAEAGDPERGKELLDKLNPKRLNPYERAYVYRLRATVSYGAGDYEEAIDYFEKTLDEQALRLDAESTIRFGIAQIHASLEHWKETIDGLNRWFLYVEAPDPLAYYLMGIAYYRLDQMDQAISYTEKAIDAAGEPKEGWLQLLAALYVQNQDYASATPVLEELVMRFAKKAYWVQLSLIYGARDNYRYSLAVQQVAYFQGLLTEDRELRRLARSYLYHDLPYPAAKVLEKGLAADAP